MEPCQTSYTSVHGLFNINVSSHKYKIPGWLWSNHDGEGANEALEVLTRGNLNTCRLSSLRFIPWGNDVPNQPVLNVVSLARLSQGAERESCLLPFTDSCLTPQEFLGALIGSDDFCGRDVPLRCGRTAGPGNENKYDSSSFARHIRKHLQN